MKKMLPTSWVLIVVLLFFYAIPYATAGEVQYTYDDYVPRIKPI